MNKKPIEKCKTKLKYLSRKISRIHVLKLLDKNTQKLLMCVSSLKQGNFKVEILYLGLLFQAWNIEKHLEISRIHVLQFLDKNTQKTVDLCKYHETREL